MPDTTHSQHLDWFSFTDLPKSQTLTPLKSQKTDGYFWRTQKCRTLCIPHAFFEGQKAEETSPSKSTLRTLKGVRQQYPDDFCMPFPRRAGRSWGLCRNRHLLYLKDHVWIPTLKD